MAEGFDKDKQIRQLTSALANYEQEINRLRRALRELLEVCKCENGCKEYDRSCATRCAEWVLRGGDPYKERPGATNDD
jgi:hypothetical protein